MPVKDPHALLRLGIAMFKVGRVATIVRGDASCPGLWGFRLVQTYSATVWTRRRRYVKP